MPSALSGKLLSLPAAFLLSALLLPTKAAAQEGGAYLEVHLGSAFVKDIPAFGSEVKLNAGYTTGGALGYRIGAARIETEVAYRHNELDDFEGMAPAAPGPATTDGDISAWSLMGNVYLDFRNRSPVTPFIGAGAGAVEISREAAVIGGRFLSDHEETGFAYQFMAGAGWDLTEKVSLNLAYRYFSAPDSEVLGQDSDYRSHNALVGVKLSF